MERKATWSFADESNGADPNAKANAMEQHSIKAVTPSGQSGGWVNQRIEKANFTGTCASAFRATGREDRMASTLSGNLYHLGGMFEENSALEAENAALMAQNDALRKTLQNGDLPQEVKDSLENHAGVSDTAALQCRLDALKKERDIFFGVLELSENLQDASSNWWDSPDTLKALPEKLKQALLGILELSDSLSEARRKEEELEKSCANQKKDNDSLTADNETLKKTQGKQLVNIERLNEEMEVACKARRMQVQVDADHLRGAQEESERLQSEVQRLRKENDALHKASSSIAHAAQQPDSSLLEAPGIACRHCERLQNELDATRERCDKYGRVAKEIVEVKKINARLQEENDSISLKMHKMKAVEELSVQKLEEMKHGMEKANTVAAAARAEQQASLATPTSGTPHINSKPPGSLVDLVDMRVAQARNAPAFTPQRACEISAAVLQGSRDVLNECPAEQRKDLVAALMKSNAGVAVTAPTAEPQRAPWAAPWSPVVAAPVMPAVGSMNGAARNVPLNASPSADTLLLRNPVSSPSMRLSAPPNIVLATQAEGDHYRSLVASMLMNLVNPTAEFDASVEASLNRPLPTAPVVSVMPMVQSGPSTAAVQRAAPSGENCAPATAVKTERPRPSFQGNVTGLHMLEMARGSQISCVSQADPKFSFLQASGSSPNLLAMPKVASSPALLSAPPNPIHSYGTPLVGPASKHKPEAHEASYLQELQMQSCLRGLARAFDTPKPSPPMRQPKPGKAPGRKHPS